MTLTLETRLISLYKNAWATDTDTEITLQEFLDGIAIGRWKKHVEWVRSAPDKNEPKPKGKDTNGRPLEREYDRRKKSGPGVTIAGAFNIRNSKPESLREPSSVIGIDLDHLNDNLPNILALLKIDQYAMTVFPSIGGEGACALFRIDPNRHLDSFEGLQVYLAEKYGLVVNFDASVKDLSRLRFVSYYPDIQVNYKVPVFKKYVSKPKKESKPKGTIHTEDDIEYVIRQIEVRNLDITEGDGKWVRVGMAFINQYGENGRAYFHRVCQFHSDYDADEADKKYDYWTKCNRGEIKIGTFYWLCKQAGLDIATPETKEESSVAAMCKKQKEKKESAVNTVLKMTGASQEKAQTIVDQVYESKEEFDTEETLFDQLELFLKQNYSLRFNEITHYIENDGKKLHDRERNDIYIAAAKTFDKLSKDNVFTILDSSAIHAYHPLKEFFVRNKARKGTGAIDALCASINHKMSGNYVEFFLRKFAVGMIGSIWGYQCPLMPIMCGEMGTGKTQFWRRYLPDELIEYYGECKFNRPGDDELLMCKKIILMSDDFDTAFLRNQTRFKNLTDAHTFSIRKPYGRAHEDLARLALLCGTSNETALIYDIDSNRRIIPILIDSFDYDAYNNIDKVDLLMEAYHAFHTYGEDGNLNAEQIRFLKKHTTQFVEVSTERDLVEKYFTIPTKKEDGELLSQGEILVHLSQHTGLKNLKPKLISQEMKSLGFVYSDGDWYAPEKKSKRGFWVYRNTLSLPM